MQSACRIWQGSSTAGLHEGVVLVVGDGVAGPPPAAGAVLEDDQIPRRAHHHGARHHQNERGDAEEDGHRRRAMLPGHIRRNRKMQTMQGEGSMSK